MLRKILFPGILCARNRSGEKKGDAEHERHRRAILPAKSITVVDDHERAPKSHGGTNLPCRVTVFNRWQAIP
jgi:hypothetical protein